MNYQVTILKRRLVYIKCANMKGFRKFSHIYITLCEGLTYEKRQGGVLATSHLS